MTGDLTVYIVIGAGIFTGAAMLPQLIKIIKEKKADDISYFMLIILVVGLAGWIWYGIRKDDIPVICTNLFSLLVNLLVLVFSIVYKKNKAIIQ